jgi:Ribbon-helix-helix protein, copG family
MSARYRRFGPRLTISLAGGDYDQLHVLAAKDEVSVSWVVRRAIEEYLRKHPRARERARPGRSSHRREDARSGSRQS